MRQKRQLLLSKCSKLVIFVFRTVLAGQWKPATFITLYRTLVLTT